MGQTQQEQTFFADPALDRVMGDVFNLAAELQVLRERVIVLEHALQHAGHLTPAALESVAPGSPLEHTLAIDRRDYVSHLLEPLLGRAASRNDLEAVAGDAR